MRRRRDHALENLRPLEEGATPVYSVWPDENMRPVLPLWKRLRRERWWRTSWLERITRKDWWL